jgi:hypothetical protein
VLVDFAGLAFLLAGYSETLFRAGLASKHSQRSGRRPGSAVSVNKEELVMFIARLSIQARFGHKQKVLELMKQWDEDIGAKIGWTGDKIRTVTGSIGAKESEIQQELTIESLAELEKGFEALAKVEGHAEWGRELEKYIVSGSNYWEIFRVA